MKVDDQVMWHEILAAVLRQYVGATLPEDVVVKRPSRCDEAPDTLLVSERRDGLHIKIISPPPVDAGTSVTEAAEQEAAGAARPAYGCHRYLSKGDRSIT